MIPNDILLLSLISALSSHHQRLPVPHIETNTETHRQTLHRERI